MKRLPRMAVAGLVTLAVGTPGCADDPFGPEDLERVSPEAVGYSSAALQAAKDHFDRIGSAAFMALHDGKVFVSWGEVDRKYLIHSIRKPLLGALYGIAVRDRVIDTAATLAQLGIDDIPPSLTPEEKEARVIDLLKSRSGVYHEAAAEAEDAAATRPTRGSHPPGTFFYYNNWDFNALGTIYEQETGRGIFEAFKLDIADPIGMQDFEVADGYYRYERDKSDHPAYHFRMTARDLARIGVLYQHNGRWGDRQVVPQSWIAESWKAHSVVDPDLGLGYGLLWVTIAAGSPLGVGPAVYHNGVEVHLLLVKPDDKLVFVHRVDTDRPWTITADQIGELFRLVLAARAFE